MPYRKTLNPKNRMSNQLVSIIIPAYNAEDTICRCLQSIVAQTYHNIEIIIIDDGSTDSTSNLVRQLQKSNPRIKLFSQSNSGVSTARNLGIKKSNGLYITFVDADDTLLPEYIESLVSALINTHSDIAICNLNFVYNKRIQHPLHFKPGVITQEEFMSALLCSIQGYVHCKMYRRSILEKAAFNPAIFMSEDLLFNVELGQNIKQAVLVDNFLYNYYQSNNSCCHSTFSIARSTKFNADKKIYNVIEKTFPKLKSLYAYHLLLATYENRYDYYKSKLRDENIEKKIQENIGLFRTQLSQNTSLIKRIKLFIYANSYGFIKFLRNIKHIFGETHDEA